MPDNRLPPEARYHRDVHFKTLVDMMEKMVHACDFTPTELREAAILAAVHYEQKTVRTRDLMVIPGGPYQPEVLKQTGWAFRCPGCGKFNFRPDGYPLSRADACKCDRCGMQPSNLLPLSEKEGGPNAI